MFEDEEFGFEDEEFGFEDEEFEDDITEEDIEYILNIKRRVDSGEMDVYSMDDVARILGFDDHTTD